MNVRILLAVLTILFSLLYSPVLAREPERLPEGQMRVSLATEDLEVLEQPANTMMRDHLTALVEAQFAQRDKMLRKLSTAEDWNRHAEHIRKSMLAWTGPLPQRTPLRSRVTGRIERKGYAVEKILFESRPGFLVSANLYLPKAYVGRRPAILNVIGHSTAGKATEKVQRRSIAQARKGFVAFTVDAIGQGERQVRDYAPHGKPPGNAHQIIGAQAFLAGTHVFNFMVWDVIRAMDYLVSRPEVDANRIGCTGCSGGGMMTTYVLPLEPRITVAVPACNPSTWLHRVRANLATDHEQVFFGAFAAGIDPRGDPLFCHLPKPLLINATSDDNLNPPAGVWELSGWLERAYSAHGQSQKFRTTMVQAPHGYNLEQREITYAWMLTWLSEESADHREGDFRIEEEPNTWCTDKGNVYDEAQSQEPHELVLAYLEEHRYPKWRIRTEQELTTHATRMRDIVKKTLSCPDHIPVPRAKVQKHRTVEGFTLTPFILYPEKGIVLPGVLLELRGVSGKGPVILYLHDKGKVNLIKDKAILQSVLAEGFSICAVDLRGQGETQPSQEGKFWDFLAGKPVFGQRVSDVLSVLNWLLDSQIGANGVYIWAKGTSALYACHAASLDSNIQGLGLEEPLLSFESVINVKVPAYRHEVLLPAVLEKYDLPQVYQALCPRPVILVNPLRGDGALAIHDEVARVYEPVAETYQAQGKSANWESYTGANSSERRELLLSYFKNTVRTN